MASANPALWQLTFAQAVMGPVGREQSSREAPRQAAAASGRATKSLQGPPRPVRPV